MYLKKNSKQLYYVTFDSNSDKMCKNTQVKRGAS